MPLGTVDYTTKRAAGTPLNEYQIMENALISSIRVKVERQPFSIIKRAFNNGKTRLKRLYMIQAQNFFRLLTTCTNRSPSNSENNK